MSDLPLERVPLALRLKRVQRRWMSITLRHYESLLPARTTYERTT